MKTERMEDERSSMQYCKPATAAHPSSPAMPSPITPADGSSFYPTATDIDGKGLMLSPRFSDVKPIVLSAPPAVKTESAVVTPYCQFQLLPQPVPEQSAAPHQQPAGAPSLLSDLDDIDALQCQWDMKHFEPGKLTESDLICLDTPAAASTAPVTTAPTSVFTPYTTASLMGTEPAADPPTSFPIFSSPFYHPYYQQPQPQQQIFNSEFTLDYSTPEVKELLCTGWLESDLLNVN